MDEQEEKLLKEVNALRHRELDVLEKRNAALLAILRASLVTLAALAAAWWGVGVLAQADLAWGRGFFFAFAAGVFFGLMATVAASMECDGKPVLWGLVTVLCVLGAALTYPY